MSWYIYALRNFSDFSGRARRKEYWMFLLINIIIFILISIIQKAVHIPHVDIHMIYSLFIAIPAFAVSVRRLHDIGKSGWWALLALIPIVGSLVLLYFHTKDSEEGDNLYGSNPKLNSMLSN
ncbi:DUF805 domain-containing protein [Grimontia kaedaensis]|uniref:DUF805 domain-containing protein n=1 Tax=Grimontia kaedaensis TaxID=2872157 RepID=A0ABY4WQT4_9GAMM|nr:DUF805 domain-containing protein [Grimontia kaedaensis]USH01405.1 DUF805 domain-containing protein [Grimontia kaedaensis]